MALSAKRESVLSVGKSEQEAVGSKNGVKYQTKKSVPQLGSLESLRESLSPSKSFCPVIVSDGTKFLFVLLSRQTKIYSLS